MAQPSKNKTVAGVCAMYIKCAFGRVSSAIIHILHTFKSLVFVFVCSSTHFIAVKQSYELTYCHDHSEQSMVRAVLDV